MNSNKKKLQYYSVTLRVYLPTYLSINQNIMYQQNLIFA